MNIPTKTEARIHTINMTTVFVSVPFLAAYGGDIDLSSIGITPEIVGIFLYFWFSSFFASFWRLMDFSFHKGVKNIWKRERQQR